MRTDPPTPPVSRASETIDPQGGWRDGTRPDEPALEVHRIRPDTVVIRQSLATHYEAPFVYLLLGASGALLLDTGATEDPSAWPLRETVDTLIDEWLRAHPAPRFLLTVAHSHSHGDHIAGDRQFDGRPETRVVGTDADEVASFFGLDRWPEVVGTFDLGGRELTIIPGPGHEYAALVVHDPLTGILFTGDTVYPGRLYVEDMPTFLATLERLVEFARERDVTALLGGHIEMSSTEGEQFELGSRRHPREAPLAMSRDQLVTLRDRARAIAAEPGMHRYDDLAIVNGRAAIDAYYRHGLGG